MLFSLSPLLLPSLSLLAAASPVNRRNTNTTSAWSVDQFSNFVAFGDSYTDESRLSYFIAHNYTAPPPGTFLPESFNTASGGRDWSRYVVQYTGSNLPNGSFSPQLTLYNYAVSGAVCDNNITPRVFVEGFDFPAVQQYEIPAFLADMGTVRSGTNIPYFTPPLSADNAVYSLWIGTNDLGVGAFITDSEIPGKTLTDYTDCVFDVFDQLYASGGRYFVLFNNAPLQLAPLYANESLNGVGPNHYWPDKPDNLTQIAYEMYQEVTSTNTIEKLQAQYSVLSNRWPGANIALYDVYSLIYDIYNDPSAYLNGTAPLSVSGFDKSCSINGSVCTTAPSPDSYLWFDELHPSEQTDRIIAMNFVDLLNGQGKYATYL
ncbi:MAG: hypothetical protein Q9227_003615 [Pyrenula ochraceoflavens]